jgi:hypothetical protein
MKWMLQPIGIALGVIILIGFFLILGGQYLKFSEEAKVTPTPVPETPAITEPPTTEPTPETTVPPTPVVTTPPPVPTLRGTYAEVAEPVRDPKVYNAPDYTTVYNPKGRGFPVIFQKHYDMDFQYEGVYADIINSPFIIDFSVSPESNSPIRSFFIITVRDNTTQKVISQDGYFRTYSAQSPKRLYFSSPGKYHITVYGGFVTADLTLRAPP